MESFPFFILCIDNHSLHSGYEHIIIKSTKCAYRYSEYFQYSFILCKIFQNVILVLAKVKDLYYHDKWS